jgi:hypothetical protein
MKQYRLMGGPSDNTMIQFDTPVMFMRVMRYDGSGKFDIYRTDHKDDVVARFHASDESGFKLRDGDQPIPIVNESESIQGMVISDLEARTQVGIQRYGTALQPFNGRDALRDAYEEALDLAVYLKQCIVERDAGGLDKSPRDG